MGSPICCLDFKADDDDQLLVAKILSPTLLDGNDFVSVFRNDFDNLVVSFKSLLFTSYIILPICNILKI